MEGVREVLMKGKMDVWMDERMAGGRRERGRGKG